MRFDLFAADAIVHSDRIANGSCVDPTAATAGQARPCRPHVVLCGTGPRREDSPASARTKHPLENVHHIVHGQIGAEGPSAITDHVLYELESVPACRSLRAVAARPRVPAAQADVANRRDDFGSAARGAVCRAVRSADGPAVNQSGLNGLASGGTSALDTGTFTVSAIQPIQYTVQEVSGLLDPANEVQLHDVHLLPSPAPHACAARAALPVL